MSRAIHARRVELGLTQGEAATRCGMSARTYCNAELGVSSPTYSTLTQIARALDTSVHGLLPKEAEAVL